MIDTLYIEHDVLDHPRTQALIQRFSRARVIEIERYGEVFNRNGQNFRLQKQQPALIIAKKQGQLLHETPKEYGMGGEENFYFSHMLNCLYDCRYCFLQGMHRSAHYILFVNYEDYFSAIEQQADQDDKTRWFFSGYDCDSLAMEPLTGFAREVMTLFESRPQAVLELRSKSTQIRSLLERDALPNVVVAFSLSPDPVVKAYEAKTPSLAKRLEALKKLSDAGWPIGLRLDPLIDTENAEQVYREFVDQLFQVLSPKRIHSISVGTFRLPKPYFKRLEKLYPDSSLLAPSMSIEADTQRVGYTPDREQALLHTVYHRLLHYCDKEQLFPCQTLD